MKIIFRQKAKYYSRQIGKYRCFFRPGFLEMECYIELEIPMQKLIYLKF